MSTPTSNEKEIRLIVENSEAIKKHLQEKYGQGRQYAFTDHIFKPRHKIWDLEKQYMVLREWHYGESNNAIATLKFAIKEYSKNIKSQKFGFKLNIPSKEVGQQVLEMWDFEFLFSFRRDAFAFGNKEIAFYLENIENLGWSLEIECEKGHEEEKKALELVLGKKLEVMNKPALVTISKNTSRNG